MIGTRDVNNNNNFIGYTVFESMFDDDDCGTSCSYCLFVITMILLEICCIPCRCCCGRKSDNYEPF